MGISARPVLAAKGFTFMGARPSISSTVSGDTGFDPNDKAAVWLSKDNTWFRLMGGSGASYGFTLQVSNGSAYDSVERITFPFDSGTMEKVGTVSTVVYGAIGFNSTQHGFSVSGLSTGGQPSSSISRFEFPFDSGIVAQVGAMTYSMYYGNATNSSTYGHILDGQGSAALVIAANRLAFPFDSGTALAGWNTPSGNYHSGSFNSSAYGFVVLGDNGLTRSTIYRYAFPFAGQPSAVGYSVNARRNLLSAGSNSSTHGYMVGGYDGLNYLSVIERLAFPFNSGTATRVGSMSQSKANSIAMNSSNYSYAIGDSYSGFSTVERLLFPFDSGTSATSGYTRGTRANGAGVDGTDFNSIFV